MDNNDWASDGGQEEGFGDISVIPEVKVATPPPAPAPAPAPIPPPNAWTSQNQSGDVRAAHRFPTPQPNIHRPIHNLQHHPNQPLPHRRPLRNNPPYPPTRPGAPGFATPPPLSTVTLYVTNLPYETSEPHIATFFSRCGVTPADVRLTRHSDTGNIKAAFVTVRETHRAEALAMNGRTLSNRALHVKIEGEDRRPLSTRSNSHRDKPGYGFTPRERRDTFDPDHRLSDHRIHHSNPHHGQRDSAWTNGNWVDRSAPSTHGDNSASQDQRGPPGMPDMRSAPGRLGANTGFTPNTEREQRADPTIPTGPPPAGRKKLVLKPRTKPPPVLEVDTRAIDGPLRSGAGATPPPTVPSGGRGDAAERTGKVGTFGARRTGSAGRGEKWTVGKESVPGKIAPGKIVPAQAAAKKEDDSKRPVLLNTFAALEVNDTDV